MYITVDGTSLFVDVEGTRLRERAGTWGTAPTIVALHGGPGFDQGYLRPGLAALASDAQVLFVDLRGQGRSDRPPVSTCTLEQMADDVAAMCEVLGIGAPIVFGHSAGGFVALHVALRHPDVVGGLLLCDSAPTLAPLPDDDPPPGLAERAGPGAMGAASRLFGGDFSAESLELFAREVAPFYAAPGHEDIPGRLLRLSSMNGEVAAHFFGELARAYDVRAQLADIHVPTGVMVGAFDWVCPPAASRAIATGIPEADLTIIPDAGHFPFSESPAAFLAAVRGVLARVGGAAAARDGRLVGGRDEAARLAEART
jgi:proline iminopeptidase